MKLVERYNKLTIFYKIVIPLLAVIFVFLVISQLIIVSMIRSNLQNDINMRIEDNTRAIHSLVELSIRGSLKNYLRGVADDIFLGLQNIHKSVLSGDISEAEAKDVIRSKLKWRKFGSEGYVYVIDSNGNIIYHPFKELEGVDVSEYEFIKRQMKEKKGFLTYKWQNPGETLPRDKALYSVYFEPWDWIITLSVYRDEFRKFIDIAALDEYISASMITKDSYSFILNSSGIFVSHPYYKGVAIHSLPEGEKLKKLFPFRIDDEKTSGIFEYYFISQGGKKPEKKILFYQWLPEFEWFVATTYLLSDANPLVGKVTIIILLVSIFEVVVFGFLFFFYSRYLTAPIHELSRFVQNQSQMESMSLDADGTKDEIILAQRALDQYIHKLESEKEKVVSISKENAILAAFPNELKLPVLRVSKTEGLVYSNKAAKKICASLREGEQLVNYIDYFFQREGSFFNIKLEDSSYRVFKTLVPASDHIFLHFYDFTLENRFQTLQSIWDNIFSTSIEGITVTDKEGVIEKINASFTKITGYSEAEAIGTHTRILKSGVHPESFYRSMWVALKEEGHWEGEIFNKRKSGEVYPEWLAISSFLDTETDNEKYIAIFHDITDLREKEKKLDYLHSHDVLTGLPNRDYFYKELHTAFAHLGENSHCAVLLMDIDGFSIVNDGLGKNFGDGYLIEVSKRLFATIRDGDTLARLGSDDFALLVPNIVHKENVSEIIYRILAHVNQKLVLGDNVLTPSLSIGVCFYPDDASDVDGLIQTAGIALNRAKSERKGSYRIFDPELDKEMLSRFEMNVALRAALSSREFYLMYQPKVDLLTNKVVGAEALLRWRHKDGSIISPDVFVPLLEESHLIIPVGRWLIQEACSFLHILKKAGHEQLTISINISANQFVHPNFTNELYELTQSNKIDPQKLELEITERIAATEINLVIDKLNEIKEHGFLISIDDFGTGYSSLKYIKDLIFDYLKIDRSFIMHLPEDKESLSIVRTIIALAKNLNKGIIAEGVESLEQRNLCLKEGCEIMQGYFYSKPLMPDDFLALLQKEKQEGN